MDEVDYYKTYFNVYLGKGQGKTPLKIYIGPFSTRAKARVFKTNNPNLIPSDAFPCPTHTVKPLIERTFPKED